MGDLAVRLNHEEVVCCDMACYVVRMDIATQLRNAAVDEPDAVTLVALCLGAADEVETLEDAIIAMYHAADGAGWLPMMLEYPTLMRFAAELDQRRRLRGNNSNVWAA